MTNNDHKNIVCNGDLGRPSAARQIGVFAIVDGDDLWICTSDNEVLVAGLEFLDDVIAAGIPIAAWTLPTAIRQRFKFIDLQTEIKMILNSYPVWCGADFQGFERQPSLTAIGVHNLVDALHKVAGIHEAMKTPWDMDQAVARGDYLQALDILQRRSAGLPIDVKWWAGVLRNQDAIKMEIANSVAQNYPTSSLWKQAGTKIRFDWQGFEKLAIERNWTTSWPRRPDGKLKMGKATLDEQTKLHADLKPFRDGWLMISSLASVDLKWDETGHVNPGSTPFHTKTGRNQPRVKDGFVFAMPPAFRVGGVRPAPGRALIALDWSKQEPAIAIGLSGDTNYRAAYESADLYVECAKRAGAVPPEGTKETHPQERQAYKSAMLGIGYGMGTMTLGHHIYADLNAGRSHEIISKQTAEKKAEEVMAWYHHEFRITQSYLETQAAKARERKWCSSSDGWIAFLSDSYGSKPQLINFPVQAEGAVMLRHAVKTLAFETDLDVCQTLHDAIYLNCDEADIDRVVATATEHMNRAAQTITDVPIHVDVKVITHTQRLVDPRADKVMPLINKWL